MGLPEDTLAGIDTLVSDTNLCRSELIREACSFYIEEKRRQNLRERMKAGYQEMAELNRLLAEEIGFLHSVRPVRRLGVEEGLIWIQPEATSTLRILARL